jgi:hypothetical protein
MRQKAMVVWWEVMLQPARANERAAQQEATQQLWCNKKPRNNQLGKGEATGHQEVAVLAMAFAEQ